jgi:hypothetical protein
MIDENPPIQPKRRSPRGASRPIQIQERDLAILYSLSVGRYLTAPAIEWLHYPGWRERYKVFLEPQKTDESLFYRPLNHIAASSRCAPGRCPWSIASLGRTSGHGWPMRVLRMPMCSRRLARNCCAHSAATSSPTCGMRILKRSIKNFEHSVAIGTCYAALRASLEFSGQQLTDWRGDHLLARRDVERVGPSYDRVRVSWVGKERKLKVEDVAVLPDATFTLNDERYFVEIDQGTTNLESWAEKVRAYEAYRQSPKLQARYATDTFIVLVVAPTETRLKRIAEEVIKITKQPSTAYLFTTADKIHPVRIRANWRALASVEWTSRKVVDRLVELPDQLRFTSSVLWKNP